MCLTLFNVSFFSNIVLLVDDNINNREELCSKIVGEITEQCKLMVNAVPIDATFEFLKCASASQIVDEKFVEGKEMNRMVYKIVNNKRKSSSDSEDDSEDDENEPASKKSKH